LLNRSRQFTNDDQIFLEEIAVHLALALERACLFEEVMQKRKLEQELALVQERLTQADKMSVMAELISGVVHEVRNPLSVLIGQCSLLREEAKGYPKLMERVEKLELASRHASKIIQNFLSFAQKPRRERTIVDLNEVIRQTLDLLSYEWKTRAITVEQQLGQVPPGIADAGEIQQVLLNLFKNAQHAVGQQERRGRIVVRSFYNAENGRVAIAVQDNGAGIPPNVRPRIFEPFVTTKPRGAGTGLGLSICRRIIKEHQGHIWFESEVGAGTTFYVEVPAIEADTGSSVPVQETTSARETFLY
jgi:signal transduction histidine kinase